MYRRFIESQLSRVRECPHAAMLSDNVYERLRETLRLKTEFIAGSSTTYLISQASDNPFAATLPDLLTEAERAQALDKIRERLGSGAMSLPEPLVACLELQLGNATSAFIESLDRMVENRNAI